MEKITITSVEGKRSQRGTTFWAVVDNNQNKYTVWDDQIAWYLKQHINQVVEIEIKMSGDYKNIRHVEMNNQNIEVNPSQKQPQASSLMSQRDISIVSQCCLKGAVELAKEHKFDNNEDLGKFVTMAIIELVGAYKLGLKQLE